MANIQIKFLLLCFCILASQTTRGVHGQCATLPINQAVYENTQNTILMCNRLIAVSYVVKPTSDPLGSYAITKYDDVVVATLRNLYDVNTTGLIIKTAQGSTTIPPISTAGLYVINPNSTTNRTGAKLVVVSRPPTCTCAANSENLTRTCSLVYADINSHVINAMMTWISNGTVIKTETPPRTLSNSYYMSTSTITVDASDPSTYTCTVTFAAPNPQFAYVAMNAPEFSASCTSSACLITTTIQTTMPTTTTTTTSTTTTPTTTSPMTTTIPPTTTTPTTTTTLISTTTISDQCLSNIRNLAVYEGQSITIMNLFINPDNVWWRVRSTSSEIDTYTIINYGGVRDQSLTSLYDVNQAGLIIKEATTTENGNPIATAGLYIGQCANNTNRTGAKLLVVRTGPLCSCISIDTNSSSVSCNVTYADSSFHPIYPIVTWRLNGAFLASYTLQRQRIDQYLFGATSTITTNSSCPDNYTCELTFAAPTDLEFPWIATNAPEFNESCSTEECNCSQTTDCPSLVQNCTKSSECQSDGTNHTDVYDECVVKVELYARCDNCCPDDLVCGVVVTLRNDSRWLIHDSSCDDNRCEMIVVDASCMSSDWKLLSDRKVIISGVGDYVQAGNSVQIGLNMTDCSESCKRMMNLP